jgi:hypothetical protein
MVKIPGTCLAFGPVGPATIVVGRLVRAVIERG